METTPTPTSTQPLLEWQAPSTAVHEHSKRWYMASASFVLLCAVYGILSGNWSFTIVILLTAAMYFLMRDAKAPLRTMRIFDHGFSLDSTYTRFADCAEYWFIVTPTYTELHIRKNIGIQREAKVHTGDVSLELLRSVLSAYLPESPDQKERIVDTLIRILKI